MEQMSAWDLGDWQLVALHACRIGLPAIAALLGVVGFLRGEGGAERWRGLVLSLLVAAIAGGAAPYVWFVIATPSFY